MAGRRALIAGLAAALLAGAAVAVIALARGGDEDSDPGARAANARVDRFDSARAFAELKRQVELGPRPAGSPTLRGLAERLRR